MKNNHYLIIQYVKYLSPYVKNKKNPALKKEQSSNFRNQVLPAKAVTIHSTQMYNTDNFIDKNNNV